MEAQQIAAARGKSGKLDDARLRHDTARLSLRKATRFDEAANYPKLQR